MLSREEEMKRSKIWQVVMTVSSVLIIIIAAFFLVKMFRSNPLEGTWRSEDADILLDIHGNSSATATAVEALEGEDIELKLICTIDKDEKTISIKADEADKEKVIEDSDGQIAEDTLENAFGSILTTFNYSVDQEELTLTEREYGEQMVFIKE